MPAVIVTPYGEAKISGGQWTGPTPEIEEYLDSIAYDDTRTPGDRDPDYELARRAVAELGGHVSSHDPLRRTPGTID